LLPVFLGLIWLLGLSTAVAETPATNALGSSLRKGGYVIVMRHASSPRTPPDAAHTDPANTQHERQLDDAGRSSAQSLGEALRRLRIPVGLVLSSPTYRALQTIQLAHLGRPQTFEQLGDGGHSMQATGTGSSWLQAQVTRPPKSGTDTFVVTHFPNIMEAFPENAAELDDGEALVFHPDGHGHATFVGRVKIDEWARLDRPH
jgi:phosphohistidine phosphatase SixA